MKKKILFVNDEMINGGVSKVLNNLLAHLDYEKYEVDLLVLHKHGEMLADVNENVTVLGGTPFFDTVDLNLNELLKGGKIIKALRKIRLVASMKTGGIVKKIQKERKKILKKKYDVEIAFKEGFCSIFVASGDSKRKINWIHVDYGVMNYSKHHMTLMKEILPWFDQHVAVSQTAAESYERIFGVKNVKVIHNLIKDQDILEKAKAEAKMPDGFNIVSVGRLHPQKAYDRLVRIHKKLIDDGYKFHTTVVGGGDLEENIREQIKDLNVEDSFHLAGNQTNPYPYVRKSDLFVLSSLYEGLPTVVYESLILKKPVVTTSVAGVKEQLENKYGIITENEEEALYKAIKSLFDHPEELKKYQDALKDYTYDNEGLLKEFYSVVNDIEL